MKQRKLFTALIVTASAIAGGSLAYASKEPPPNDAVALFSKAKVTLIQAIAAAEQHAQHVVLTSDNPRSEDPLAILAQMRAGLAHPDVARIEPDRAAAIARAVQGAAAHDVVLIAGKGHEDYQDSMGVKTPFSDLLHARAALAQRQGQGVHA